MGFRFCSLCLASLLLASCGNESEDLQGKGTAVSTPDAQTNSGSDTQASEGIRYREDGTPYPSSVAKIFPAIGDATNTGRSSYAGRCVDRAYELNGIVLVDVSCSAAFTGTAADAQAAAQAWLDANCQTDLTIEDADTYTGCTVRTVPVIRNFFGQVPIFVEEDCATTSGTAYGFIDC